MYSSFPHSLLHSQDTTEKQSSARLISDSIEIIREENKSLHTQLIEKDHVIQSLSEKCKEYEDLVFKLKGTGSL